MDNPSTAAIKGPLVDTSYVSGKRRIFTEFLDDCDLIMTIFHSTVKVDKVDFMKEVILYKIHLLVAGHLTYQKLLQAN